MLSRSSKKFSRLPERFTKVQINMNSILRHFVKDPEVFRLEMAQKNAVIVGGVASHFFNRFIPLKDDMNLIVTGSREFIAFAKYICDEEGYTPFRTSNFNCSFPCDRPRSVGDTGRFKNREGATDIVRVYPHSCKNMLMKPDDRQFPTSNGVR